MSERSRSRYAMVARGGNPVTINGGVDSQSVTTPSPTTADPSAAIGNQLELALQRQQLEQRLVALQQENSAYLRVQRQTVETRNQPNM